MMSESFQCQVCMDGLIEQFFETWDFAFFVVPAALYIFFAQSIVTTYDVVLLSLRLNTRECICLWREDMLEAG